jgi:glycosyltransferase involved in cell wall biosynthesis
MSRDLVTNGRFTEVPTQNGTPKLDSKICNGWFLEFAGAQNKLDLALKPLGGPGAGGLTLQIREGRSWVRLWQPIEVAALRRHRNLQVSLRARRTPGATEAPRLLWVALLQKGASGKRVFAKIMLSAPVDVDDSWSVLTADVPVEGIPEGACILAIQFGERLGSIDLEEIALIGDPITLAEPARPAPVARVDAVKAQAAPVEKARSGPLPMGSVRAAAPTQAAASGSLTGAREEVRTSQALVQGGFLAWQGRTLLGWTRLSLPAGRVEIIANGRSAGYAELGSPPAIPGIAVPREAETGFAFEMPIKMLDGIDYVVTVRDPRHGYRLFRTKLRVPVSEAGDDEVVWLINEAGDPEKLKRAPAQKPQESEKTALQIKPVTSIPTQEQSGVAMPDAAAADATAAAARPRCCVVSWDMAHNPVGRAFLLADMAARFAEVELVGPLFTRYGTSIWPPIAELEMRMRSFPASDMRSFLEGAVALAKTVECDVVHVGKARLPSLILGALIRHQNKCPMIVDVDDHELSFFPERSQATLAEVATGPAAEIDAPYSELWTRHAETLVEAADGVTVSNYNLQSRFGGIVVRHGRDERQFDPKLHNRAATRAAFGYKPEDRVILFLGTPRPHKGVFSIADALEKVADDRLALCVIGSINDKRVSNRFAAYKKARIALHLDQPWQRLPELVAMADAVFLLQDPASAIAEYQIPAKLTDALALGVPCYATPVPPLVDLIAAGALIPIESDADLLAALRSLAQNGNTGTRSQRVRDYYLSELSYEVNAARLKTAVASAAAALRPSMPAFDALFDMLEAQTGVVLPRFQARPRAPAIWKNAPPDVVFLWKQNDSDIYGRRPDMIAKYLLRSGKVRRIIHFDAPISATDLEKQPQHGAGASQHQGNLVYQNTMRRVLRLADTPSVIRRTFLHRSGRQPERMLGLDLPPRDAYADFVKETLQEAHVSEAPMLWVCPVVFDYPAVRSVVKPSMTVADIVDDQRAFPGREAHRKRLVEAYEAVLRDADLVVSNCVAVQAGFADIRADINVVPNGAEVFNLDEAWDVPEEFLQLPRPILGYVGNLRDRVDLDLIRKTAKQNSHGSVVLIGSAHGRPEVLELGKLPNVHLLGVRPYSEAVRFIRAFDVAIMPHLRNELSENMNPLKLYVYFALGVPIVTTEVANIGDIAPFAAVAETQEAFLQAVSQAALERTVRVTEEQRRAVLSKVSWDARVQSIFNSMAY